MKIKLVRGNEGGTTLLETLVALAVLGALAVTFLSGLATTTRATTTADAQTVAESLARQQMEYLKDCAYAVGAAQYAVDPALTVPSGWTVLPAAVQSLRTPDDGIQQVTVTVQRNGETVLVMEGYKVNR